MTITITIPFSYTNTKQKWLNKLLQDMYAEMVNSSFSFVFAFFPYFLILLLKSFFKFILGGERKYKWGKDRRKE